MLFFSYPVEGFMLPGKPVMNESGFTLVELVVSLMIVSGILIPSLTVYQQLNVQSAQVMEDWEAFWKVKGVARQWQQNQTILLDEGESYQIQWSEKKMTTTMMEGEFRIRWTSGAKGKERVFYAYKRVEPSPSY